MKKLNRRCFFLFVIILLSLVKFLPIYSQAENLLDIENIEQKEKSYEKVKNLEENLNILDGYNDLAEEEKIEILENFKERLGNKLEEEMPEKKKDLAELAANNISKYRDQNEIIVAKEGDIKTIREALALASENENIKSIIIKEGIYQESDLLLVREKHSLKIEGDGQVEIRGNLIFTSPLKNSPEILVKNIILNGEGNHSEILGENIGIGSGNLNTNLENIEIKSFDYPIMVDSAEGLSYLKIKDSKIHHNLSELLVFNTSASIDNLDYSENMGAIFFENTKKSVEDSDLMKISYKIKNSKIYKNKPSSDNFSYSIIDGKNIDGEINNSEIYDNILIPTQNHVYKSIINTRVGYYDYKHQNKLYILDCNIYNNRSEGIYKYDSFLYAKNTDVNISNTNIYNNSINFNRLDNCKLDMTNINQKEDIEDGNLEFYISNSRKMKEINLNKVKLNSNKNYKKDPISFLKNVDLNIRDVDLDLSHSIGESIVYIKNSILDIGSLDYKNDGDILILIDESEIIPNRVNVFKDINIKLRDAKNTSNNMINIIINTGIYQFEDIDIDKESFNSKNIIAIKADILGYKNISLKNLGSFISDMSDGPIRSESKNRNQLFLDNIDIYNDIDTNQSYNIVPIAIKGQDNIELQAKDISIYGSGQIVEYFYLDNLKKVDLYQVKGMGHRVFSPLKYNNVGELNIYNSTLDNRNLSLAMYPNIDLNRSKINMYNTIFLVEGLKTKNINNSIVNFETCILLEDLSQFDENFINNETNIFGLAKLDELGRLKKDSIGIDQGNNNYAQGIEKDLEGKDRIINDIVDIGAYEYKEDDEIDPPVDPPINPPHGEASHRAYIVGFEDGSIRPNGFLSRHEAAIVLYQIIDSEVIRENYSERADFIDIDENYWGQKYIATLENIGLISGLPDGSFKPRDKVSRGEFARMISYFTSPDKGARGERKEFTDISGHWAEEYIYLASQAGWLSGYPDGSFRPDKHMTRIELMILVNRIEDRGVVLENSLEGVKKFTDVDEDYIFYNEILEASNSHKYKIEDGQEIWLDLLD